MHIHNRIISLLFIFSLLFIGIDPASGAEAPVIIWEHFLGGGNVEKAYSIHETSDRGYILAGFSCSDDGDVTSVSYKSDYCDDYWVVRLDTDGNLLWQTSSGGSGIDTAYFVTETADQGFIIAGSSTSNQNISPENRGDYDYYVVKLDFSGNPVWERFYGGFWTDEPGGVWETDDHMYMVAGYSDSSDGDVAPDHRRGDPWIIKLNQQGDIIWQNSSIDPEEYPKNNRNASGSTLRNLWMLTRAANSSLVWESVTGQDASEAASITLRKIYDIYVDSDPISLGMCEDCYDRLDRDILLVRLDDDGNLVWDEFLDAGGIESARDFTSTSTHEIVIAGDSFSFDDTLMGHHGAGDFYVAKIGVLQSFPGTEKMPLDLDQDGIYEDVNGDGMFNFNDVLLFLSTNSWISRNQPISCFDTNNDQKISFADPFILYMNQIQDILSR